VPRKSTGGGEPPTHQPPPSGPPSLLRSPATYVILAGIACIIIFFAIQPKHNGSSNASTSAGGNQLAGSEGVNSGSPVGNQPGQSPNPNGNSSGGGSPPSTPPQPAPKPSYSKAWGPTVITQQINTSFDLKTHPPPEENAISGFEVSEYPGVNGQTLQPVAGGAINQWNRNSAPSPKDCVKSLEGGSAQYVVVENPGVWVCAQTPEGLIASFRSAGSTGNGVTSIQYRFRVTVWNPGS
jgi:hypothetical protein